MPVLRLPRGQLQRWPVLPLDIPSRPPQRPWRGWFLFGALLLATLVIVSHGCHGSDHDDEPAWFRLPGASKETKGSAAKPLSSLGDRLLP